jgi:diacylglycerol kinase family enzyme
LRELVKELHRRGLKPRLFRHRERVQAWMSSPENLSQLRCLVAAGGDGTVGDLITRYPGIPLAIFPMGTENLFAKFLKIPRSGRLLADLIADGKTRRYDLAQIGSRRFCLMASIGLDAQMVHESHATRRGHIQRWQYIGPIWRAWSRAMYGPKLRVFCDDDPQPRAGRSLFVMNQPAYALRFQIAPGADGHDGRLDLRIYEWSSRWNLLWMAGRAWWGGWERMPNVTVCTAQKVRIESDKPAAVQVDGDPCGETPAEIELIPDALEVFAP